MWKGNCERRARYSINAFQSCQFSKHSQRLTLIYNALFTLKGKVTFDEMNKMKMRDFHQLRYLVMKQLETEEGRKTIAGEEVVEQLEDANIKL